MFWSKSKPAAPPVITSYDPSALEKGKETDRRSSFSSANSSPQTSPTESLPESLPQLPKATYSAPVLHSQTQSVDEHPSAGLQSFPVLSTNGHRHRRTPTATRRFLCRYWFLVALALLATVGILGAIAAVMVKNKQTGGDVYYLPAHQTANVTLPFSSYVIIENGSIISTVVGHTSAATATPTAS